MKAAVVAMSLALVLSIVANIRFLIGDDDRPVRSFVNEGGGVPAAEESRRGDVRASPGVRRTTPASAPSGDDETTILRDQVLQLQAELKRLKEEDERLQSKVDEVSRAAEQEEAEKNYVAQTMTELANTTELQNFAGAKGQRRMLERLLEILPARKAADLTKLYFMLCMYEGRNALPTRSAGQWKPSPETAPEIDAKLLSWRSEIERAGSIGRFVEERITEIAGRDALSALRSAAIPPFADGTTANFAELRSQWDLKHPLYPWRRFLVNE